MGLIIPSATLVNAVFFQILPTIMQGRVVPGVYAAATLYVPFSSWALIGASGDGVPCRALVTAFVAGAVMMTGMVSIATLLSP